MRGVAKECNIIESEENKKSLPRVTILIKLNCGIWNVYWRLKIRTAIIKRKVRQNDVKAKRMKYKRRVYVKDIELIPKFLETRKYI